MYFDAIAMSSGTITFVLVPAVMGILMVEVAHIFIAVGFGQNACRGYGCIYFIALYHALVYYAKIRAKNMPVYQ